MNRSASAQFCPECGLELPAGATAFGCPGCSLRLALSPTDASDELTQSPLPGLKSRFFGDYEIVSEIARGGMGVVFRARQLGLNRLVALKMIQSGHLLSEEARLRFDVEIDAVAQLHHPHIVSLYESGEHEGTHYFTMRLVDGGDLAAQLKREGPLRARIQLLVKVCRAVHYAHQRGILHRDLKPSNILVDEQGEPHVADFGLAKSVDPDSGFTFSASVLGSPNYMAPEQAAGKTRQLTTAVDVYGLGAILYHMLAGRPPFQAKTPIETLRQVIDDDPTPPRALKRQVDSDLETICLKCLRKEPGQRYGTAEELAQDLERWLAGRAIFARPLGPWSAAWRWSRRHPVAAALGVSLIVALATIAIGSGLAVMRIQRAEQQSTASLRESLLREARSLRLESELGHRTEGLRLVREASALGGSAEFRLRARNELIATLGRTELEFVPMNRPGAPADPELSSIHPGFEMLASVEDGTNVVLRAWNDGSVLGRIVSAGGPVTRVGAFSPNGRFLTLQHQDALSIWDLQSQRRCLSHAGTNTVLAFHPREDAVLLQASPNEAVWFGLPSGVERLRWKAPVPRPAGRASGWHTLAFSPDGQMLAGAAVGSIFAELLDAHTGNQIRILSNNATTVAMSWKRSGDLLALATADGRIFLHEPSTGRLHWWSPAMTAAGRSLAFHPQRNWLAVACDDRQVRFVDLTTERVVYEHPADGRHIRFSPDGNRLGMVQSEGKSGWLQTRPTEEFADFSVSRQLLNLSDARFSADNRILAVGHLDMVVLCDPDTGTRLRTRQDWRTAACIFHPRENDMLVGTTNGILRYHPRFADGGLSFSRREIIHADRRWTAFDFTPDGKFFAAFSGQSNAAFVFDATLTNRIATLGPHREAESVAISPDGRWVATGSRIARSVCVWNVSTSALLETWSAGVLPRVSFSSDGRWLAIHDTRKSELRETATWKLARPLPLREGNPILGAAAFSPDSRLLALVVDRFNVHLFDLQRFESVGILRPPGSRHILGLTFSPDGSRLAAFGAEAHITVWNLQKLQQRLAEFGLAWEFQPAESATANSTPRSTAQKL